MVPIFNISSVGGSATVWLANVLNRHPRVVCLHALRDDPFHRRPIDAADMLAGLRHMHDITDAMKTFGVIHSFYDAAIRAPIEAAGGGFMAVVRHPVSRIHSLFVHHYRDLEGHAVSGDDIYAMLVEQDQVEAALATFDERVGDTLFADMHNAFNAPAAAIAVFEQFTVDADYCRTRLEALLDEGLADFEPVILSMMGRKSNQHVTRPTTPDEIYARWPRAFRDRFQEYAHRLGLVGVRDAYRRFGYDVAPMLIG